MTWLAWRLFRTQALITLALLAAFAVLVLVTGLHLRDVYDSLGGGKLCGVRNDCAALGEHETVLADLLGPVLLAIPALLGVFWGAPLVARELESGTYRLAWTQTVTRRRWLSVRVALVGVAALAVAGLATWLVSWWFAPLDAVNVNRFDPSVFTARAIVAIGYAGFAVALGLAAGALLRRTLPAMAATLLGFAAARIAFTLWVRPHLLPAREVLESTALGKGVYFASSPSGASVGAAPPPIPNAWMLSATIVDRAHRALGTPRLHDLLVRLCPRIAAGQVPDSGGKGPAGGASLRCQVALSHHVQQLVTYQPPGHYWALQAIETGVFLTGALALICATVWRLGRRAGRTRALGGPHRPATDPPAVRVTPEEGMPPVRTSGDEAGRDAGTRRHLRLAATNRPRRT